MPGKDKTGPTGQGALSGRGAGYCRGARHPGFTDRRMGYGQYGGGGNGFGRGHRHRSFGVETPTVALKPVQDPDAVPDESLIDRVEQLQAALDDIKRRLTDRGRED